MGPKTMPAADAYTLRFTIYILIVILICEKQVFQTSIALLLYFFALVYVFAYL